MQQLSTSISDPLYLYFASSKPSSFYLIQTERNGEKAYKI